MYKLDQAKQTDEEILPAAESEVTSEFEMFEQREDDSDVEREGESEVETHADEIEL
jgi:hypothetical protein